MGLHVAPCTRTAHFNRSEALLFGVYRCLVAVAGWRRGWTCHGRQRLAVAIPHLAGLLTLVVYMSAKQASHQRCRKSIQVCGRTRLMIEHTQWCIVQAGRVGTPELCSERAMSSSSLLTAAPSASIGFGPSASSCTSRQQPVSPWQRCAAKDFSSTCTMIHVQQGPRHYP